MVDKWASLPLDKPLFANLDPDQVVGRLTAVENGFINELGGHTRFPSLTPFVTLPDDNGRVYLFDFQGDMIAGTSKGRLYRINRSGTPTDVTGIPVGGGNRMVFSKSPQELYAAAGGSIIRLRSTKSEILSTAAPIASHVAYLNGYVLAFAVNSQRWFYSNPGAPDQWPALNVFSANSSSENITAMMVDPFGEIFFGGLGGTEQWLPVTTGGNVPFYRVWSVGEGIKIPYCLLFADNSLWTVNKLDELVSIRQQTSQVASG